MFYQLPPVGNPIRLSARVEKTVPPILTEKDTRYYASGTAALAAAISAAITKRTSSLSGVQVPEVILPAYACPDLISAIVFNGARPVLVDLAEDRPWLDLTQLSSAITKNTVAIVAVTLFGIAERWQQLREVVTDDSIVLIEDSAQYFPTAGETVEWQGDLVIFSFGRGKPVSLLGGGAVLCQRPELLEMLPEPETRVTDNRRRITYNIKAELYNAVISPRLYWLPHSLPFLHLGETRYHRLHDIAEMDQVRLGYLSQNIKAYQDDNLAVTRNREIAAAMDSVDSVLNLPQVCKIQEDRRLLRYPVLLPEAKRDRCYQMLLKAGLGASILYPASLPDIDGVNDVLVENGAFPNAELFASRLLTLPTHANVSAGAIEKMKFILTKYA